MLEYGANPNIRDKNKKLPIEHAIDPRIKAILEPVTNFDSKDNMKESQSQKQKLIEELKEDNYIELEIKRKKEQLLKMKMESDDSISNRPARTYSQYTAKNEDKKLEVVPIGKQKLKPTSFEIMQPLGAGAFGQVFLVKNKNNKEIMAMKIIDKERLQKDDLMPYANTEKNIMLHIQHPFIIALKHSFQTPEKFFLLMEYC